jgi:hypothetical protein
MAVLIAAVAGLSLARAEDGSLDQLRLNQIQMIGTHNSYHVAPDAVAAKFIRNFAAKEAESVDYSLPPLVEQLQRIGVRQLELDLFLDPEGKLFHSPAMLELARQKKVDVPPHDPAGRLKKPGIKILHSPDFDFRTTVYSFDQALRDMKAWSDEQRDHTPVFVLLELKTLSFSPLTRPLPWDATALATLEKEIEAVWPRERILKPDDVRAEHATLREAILRGGWPTLKQARGKVVFLLDNEDSVRSTYLSGSEVLKERLLFVSVGRDHPAAAWMKRNDAVSSLEEIQQLVKAGFLVRTRADDGRQARTKDFTLRDKAFASGAQLISTDFPEADRRFPDYEVHFDGGAMLRKNVVAAEEKR